MLGQLQERLPIMTCQYDSHRTTSYPTSRRSAFWPMGRRNEELSADESARLQSSPWRRSISFVTCKSTRGRKTGTRERERGQTAILHLSPWIWKGRSLSIASFALRREIRLKEA